MKLAYEKVLTLTGHTKAITSVAFHPEGQILASGAQDHSIRIWDLRSGKSQHCYYHHSSVLCLTWISNTVHCGFEDGYLLAVTLDNTVQRLIAQGFKAHASPLECIASQADGQFLATGGRDKICIWRLGDANTDLWEMKTELGSPPSGQAQDHESVVVTSLHWHTSRRPNCLIVSYLKHGIICWDIETKNAVWGMSAGYIVHASVSPDRKHVAVSNYETGFDIYSLETSLAVKSFPCTCLLEDQVFPVLYIHEGHRLLIASGDGCVKVWDADHDLVLQTLHHSEKKLISAIAEHYNSDNDHFQIATVENSEGAELGEPCAGDIVLWQIDAQRMHHIAIPSAVHDQRFWIRCIGIILLLAAVGWRYYL